MDLKQHAQKMKELAAKTSAQATLSIRVPAANRGRASVINRIVNEGRATDGSKIGSYSTKPAYYSRKQFVKKSAFKPKGKIKTGTSTMYLQGGYSQFRQIQGRRTDFKNLSLSGDMMLDYQQEAQGANILIGFTKVLQSNKRKGQERQTGKQIFKWTRQELDTYNKECANGYRQLLITTLR